VTLIKIAIAWLSVAFLLVLAACSVPNGRAETPIPDLKGSVIPWGSTSKSNARKIVLCKIVGEAIEGECVLMSRPSTTNHEGNFSVTGLSAGNYFILYDSGLEDFDRAMERWGGQTLYFGDADWIADFLGVDIRSEPVEFRVPNGISHSPHSGWLTQYCTLTLAVGNSPFIVAHDMKLAESERILRCHIIEFIPGQQQSIKLEVAYFGKDGGM
jgi:hypothetical protein